jgi:hypothetical protein
MSIRVPQATGWRITGVYTLIAVVMTWPVALTIGSHLASDVGDPAFVCWILAWDAGQILAALGGDLSALANYWNGNIFYPAPLTLAYSEHFTGQALQIVPVYALTGNIILCYNLLFISTFVLSGLAVFLLVRDLTGRPLAAFLAGLAYAFAPYRMGQFSHLQVLSSYWMPLALYGFHHYFARITMGSRGRALLWPLGGAAAAVVMQNLSCAYYMMFFAPFVVGYCAYESLHVPRRSSRCARGLSSRRTCASARWREWASVQWARSSDSLPTCRPLPPRHPGPICSEIRSGRTSSPRAKASPDSPWRCSLLWRSRSGCGAPSCISHGRACAIGLR